MPAAATANRNAVLTVEGIKLEVLAADAAGRQLKLNEVRELPLIHVPSDLALAATHARRSSDRRRGGLLVRDCSRHARPWQKPLIYDTWSSPIAHRGGRPCYRAHSLLPNCLDRCAFCALKTRPLWFERSQTKNDQRTALGIHHGAFPAAR